jgi:hypothetical protein
MFAHLLGFVSIAFFKGGNSWWNMILEELGRGISVIFSLTLFFVTLFVLTIVFYLAGLLVVGKKRASLSDAFIISLLGTALSTLFVLFIPYRLLALALSILTWLFLIKRLYETGWLGAIAVGILAIIIYLALLIILALIFGIIEVVLSFFAFTFTL